MMPTTSEASTPSRSEIKNADNKPYLQLRAICKYHLTLLVVVTYVNRTILVRFPYSKPTVE